MAKNVRTTWTNINAVGLDKSIWIVCDADDAQSVEKKGGAAALLDLDNGDDLTRWTPSAKFGDYSELGKRLAGLTVYFVPPAGMRTDKKFQSFSKGLRDFWHGHGATFQDLVLAPGEVLWDKIQYAENLPDAAANIALMNRQDATDGAAASRGAETADLLYNLAVAAFDLHRTDDGVSFLTKKEGPNFAWLLEQGARYSVGSCLAREAVRTMGVPARRDLAAAVDAIEAMCEELEPEKLCVRNARDAAGNHWIDLGRNDGALVRITPTGWASNFHTSPEGIYFNRTHLTTELPLPEWVEPDQAREMLRGLLRPFVNVPDEDWPLLVAWMVTHMLDGTIAPILLMISNADAGKSTSTMAVRHAVEGKLTKGSTMQPGVQDLAVTMSKERVSVFNNVSKITKVQSNWLCEVIDGTETNKRKLRTDDAVHTMRIDSSVIINGITTGMLQGDFKTRAVKVDLKPIPGVRLSDLEIKEQLTDNHPRVLGCLFSICSQVLAQLERVVVPAPQPRMIDYARVLIALDDLWGLNGTSMLRYSYGLTEMNEDAVDDLLFKVVHQMAVRPENMVDGSYVLRVSNRQLRDTFNLRKAEQLASMEGVLRDRSRGLFENGAQMRSELTKLKSEWGTIGVEIINEGRQQVDGVRDSFYTFRFTPRGGAYPWAAPDYRVSIPSTDDF